MPPRRKAIAISPDPRMSMLKYLKKTPDNTDTIKKLAAQDEAKYQRNILKKEQLQTLQATRLELGLSNQKAGGRFFPLPYHAHNLPDEEGQIERLFIRMECRAALVSIVDQLADSQAAEYSEVSDESDVVFEDEPLCVSSDAENDAAIQTDVEPAAKHQKTSLGPFKSPKTLHPWSVKAKAIYYYLHTMLGNGRLRETATAFGYSKTTLGCWLDKKKYNYWQSWLPYVSAMTPEESISGVVSESERLFLSNRMPQIKEFGQLKLQQYNVEGEQLYMAAIRDEMTIQKKVAISNKNPDKFVLVKRSAKRVTAKQRVRKYPEPHQFLKEIITKRWETGDPITSDEVWFTICQRFNCPEPNSLNDEFKKIYVGPTKRSTFSTWLKRALKTLGYSIRKRTISQKVPKNWAEVAMLDSARICEVMKERGVTVLLNADETFVKFYPEDSKVIAVKGAKRVGSTVDADQKLGCTVMVTMEYFTSSLLPPFIVLEAKHEGALMKEWESYPGPGKVVFQPSHWVDWKIAVKYLNWLKERYPDETIGLIWDHAGAHIKEEVLEHAHSIGVEIEFINKGMTSIQQPCDLWANCPAKNGIKKRYYAWRMEQSPKAGQKLKIPRETFIHWVEEAFKALHDSQVLSKDVQKTFQKCGLDPYDDLKLSFEAHLTSMGNEQVYNSLLQNQMAAELD